MKFQMVDKTIVKIVDVKSWSKDQLHIKSPNHLLDVYDEVNLLAKTSECTVVTC